MPSNTVKAVGLAVLAALGVAGAAALVVRRRRAARKAEQKQGESRLARSPSILKKGDSLRGVEMSVRSDSGSDTGSAARGTGSNASLHARLASVSNSDLSASNSNRRRALSVTLLEPDQQKGIPLTNNSLLLGEWSTLDVERPLLLEFRPLSSVQASQALQENSLFFPLASVPTASMPAQEQLLSGILSVDPEQPPRDCLCWIDHHSDPKILDIRSKDGTFHQVCIFRLADEDTVDLVAYTCNDPADPQSTVRPASFTDPSNQAELIVLKKLASSTSASSSAVAAAASSVQHHRRLSSPPPPVVSSPPQSPRGFAQIAAKANSPDLVHPTPLRPAASSST